MKDFDQANENSILEYLIQHFGNEVFTPGLDRTHVVYASFISHFKDQGTRVVTIAGTNGKGQTAHTLANMLALQGRSLGLWTSPHILSIRERFVFAKNSKISDVTYSELQDGIKDAEELLVKKLADVKVSFYEFLFLVFLILAKKRDKLDYLILEVGLGGRLDAVNHFDADCACITSISRDHQSLLGSRYEQILSEKIAVSRKDRALFTNFNLQYLNELTSDYVHRHKVLWKPIERVSDQCSNYFLENQNLAWVMFKHLEPATDLTFERAILQIETYKGRREIMTFLGKSLIFIGAHNIDGVRRMLESFSFESEMPKPSRLLVSFSARPINEVEVMTKSLVDYYGGRVELTFTSFLHPKALDEVEMRKICLQFNEGIIDFVSDWKSILKNNKKETILVCGSYYFIGEVQRFINS